MLTAALLEKSAMRYTPAGLPVLDLLLKHEAEIIHMGQARRVAFEVKARGIGEITQKLGRLEMGQLKGFAGFLGPQRNGRGVVFHVTDVDLV